MALTPLKEKDLLLIPTRWRKLVQETINLLIGSANSNAPAGVKIYKALISQSGSDAPTVVILENTIGNIVWTRTGDGVYIGTLAGAFNVLKTNYSIVQSQDSGEDTINGFNVATVNSMMITTYTLGVVGVDGVLSDTPLLIETYP